MLEDFRLKVFTTVAQTGSFTKAARALKVTQPAISQNINALEKELGVRLFTRGKGEVTLTGEGVAFRRYSERILYWYESAGNMFGDMGILTNGKPVNIVADEVSAAYILPKVIASVTAAKPKVRFYLSCESGVSGIDTDSDAVEDAGQTHIAVTAYPSPDVMDFDGEGKLVGIFDAAVIASPLNKSVSEAAVNDDEAPVKTEAGTVIAKVKPFSTLAGIPTSNRFVVWSGYLPLLAPDIRSRVAVSVSSPEAVCRIVSASSDLIGILPEIAVNDERLLRMPVLLPHFSYDVHFDPRPEFAGTPICKLIHSLIVDVLRHH